MLNSGKIRNLVTDIMDEHRVCRKYLDKQVPQKLLERILMSAIRSPSSINGQSVSYIVVEDSIKKEEIAKLCGRNPHIIEAPVFILFAMDFYRGQKACEKHNAIMKIQASIDSIMVGSVDCGIALSTAIMTAESLGLGTCPIGSVRDNADAISEILNLPPYVFGVVGLTLGYSAETMPLKPRFPYNTLVHKESYKREGVEEAITDFDKEVLKYNEEIQETYPHRAQHSWSEFISYKLKEISNPRLKDLLREKGFSLLK